MRIFCIFSLSVLLAIGFTQCSRSGSSGQPAEFHNKMNDLSPTEFELCNASTEFGFEVFKEIQMLEDPGENYFISPISISYGLGMLYNGATGETREEIAQALRVSGYTEQEINEGYMNIAAQLPLVDPRVEILISNSVWMQIGLPVLQTFLDVCDFYFDANNFHVDFTNPSTADLINQWAYDNTKGLIDKIVEPDDLEEIVLGLMNAVYFKGVWKAKFDPDETYEGLFHLEAGPTVTCSMMKNEGTFKYLQNSLFEAVNLPYGNGPFSMTVLLPQPQLYVDELIELLNGDDWDVWLQNMQFVNVALELPRFQFEYKTEDKLKQVLKNMGMIKAFYANAELHNIIDESLGVPLWVDDVKHGAYVRVDEEGTEAAAVTIVAGTTGHSSFPMVVDRPFVFMIHEEVTGTMLFMGRVCEPVW